MKISLNLVWVWTGKIGGLSYDNNEKLWIINNVWNKNDEADTNVIKETPSLVVMEIRRPKDGVQIKFKLWTVAMEIKVQQ